MNIYNAILFVVKTSKGEILEMKFSITIQDEKEEYKCLQKGQHFIHSFAGQY